jgi:hypothetical protein
MDSVSVIEEKGSRSGYGDKRDNDLRWQITLYSSLIVSDKIFILLSVYSHHFDLKKSGNDPFHYLVKDVHFLFVLMFGYTMFHVLFRKSGQNPISRTKGTSVKENYRNTHSSWICLLINDV